MARPRLDQPNFRLALRGDRYYVRWWRDGAWHRVSAGTADRGAAEQFLARLIAGALSPAPPPAPTVSAILDGYLADRQPRVAAFATLRHAAAALRRHLGQLEPAHLTRTRCRLYVRQRAAEGYQVGPPGARRRKPVARATVTRELVTLRAALRWALRERWIAEEPYIETPGSAPPRDRWLSRDEAARLLAACRAPHVRLFVALALYTTARTGAILGLTWAGVDLARGVIDFGAGQGNKRRAVVPIAAPLLPLLAEARAGATGRAVVEHGGAPVAAIKTGFAAACRRAGLVGVTPHTLRHTGATWMAIAGVPLADIARFLGNSEAVTERVYAKHSPDYLRAAAAALSGPG